MNLSRGAELFELMKKKWFDTKMSYEMETISLLRVSSTAKTDFMRFFLGWIHPILSIMYFVLLVLLLYIFVKEKMILLVHGIIILSNTVVVLPMVVVAPIILVFFHFGNVDEPMPYPWCHMYYVLMNNVVAVTRTVALYLKVLLAINRCCCVYAPFKTVYWFRRRRSILYTCITFGVSITISGILNFSYQSISFLKYYGEIWQGGSLTNYHACSFSPLEFKGDASTITYIFPVLNLAINAVGFLMMIVLNVLFIAKVRSIKQKRKGLTEGNRPIGAKKTEQRIDHMNTISSWILSVMILCEVPRFVNEIMALYAFAYTARTETEELIRVEEQFSMMEKVEAVYRVIHTLTASLDVIIFVAMSTKTKKAIKSRFCSCKPCR